MTLPPPIRLTPTQIAVLGLVALAAIAVLFALSATLIEMRCGPFCALHVLLR